MLPSSNRRRVSVTPIECNDESEQIESTSLFHLSHHIPTASTQLVGIQSPICVVSPAYEAEVPTLNRRRTSKIYIHPNPPRMASVIADDPSTLDAFETRPIGDDNKTVSDYKNKVHCLEGHKDSVLCVATCKVQNGNQCKQYIFSGSQDSSIGVWNTETFQFEGILLGHSRSILGLYVMNRDGATPCLVSTSRDNCICLWDIASLSLLFRITGFSSLVYDIECLCFANDGGYYLYGCCQDTNIFVLSLSILPYLMRLHHEQLRIEYQHKQEMARVALKKKATERRSKSRRNKMTSECDKSDKDLDCISMFNASNLALLNNPSILCPTNVNGPWMDTEPSTAADVDSTPQKKGKENDALSSGTPVSRMILSSMKFQLPTSTSEIKELITSDPTVQFLSKSVDELIDIYYDLVYAEKEEKDEAADEREPFMLHRLFMGCHRGFIYVMRQIANKNQLITCSSDGTCKIWDVSNKYKLKLLSVLTGHTHSVIDCDLMSDPYLVTASRDATVKVWNIGDIHKPHTRHTIKAHDSELTAVKVIEGGNADARIIVSASRSGRVIFCSGKSYDVIAMYSVDVPRDEWMEDQEPTCVMRFEFMEPSWLLLCDTANTVQIWNIKEILRNPTLQLSTCAAATAADTESYTMDTVLTRLGLSQYITQFKAQKVDYSTLLCLTESDLIEISIPFGPRKKLCKFIHDIKSNTNRSALNRDENMIADLKEFVAFKSISSKVEYQSECWNAAYFIQKLSETFGAVTRLVQGNPDKNPVLLAKFASNCKGKKPIRIVMYGHYDVVDIHNATAWKSPPFELTGRNGCLYGRGVMDNKGFVLLGLYGVREFLEHIENNESVEIIMIIEGYDEYGWKTGGLTHVVEQNMDWLAEPVVIFGANANSQSDEGVPCVSYGMRGHLQINVEINGAKQDCDAGQHGGAFTEPMFDLITVLGKLKQNNVVQVPGFYDDILPINENEQKLFDEMPFDKEKYLKRIGFDHAMDKIEDKDILMHPWRNPSLSVHNVQQSSNECRVISKHASATIAIRTVSNQSNIDIINKCETYLLTEFNKLSTLNTIGITARNISEHWLMDYNHFVFKCADQAVTDIIHRKLCYTRQGCSIPSINYLHNKLKAPILQLPIGQFTDRARLDNERIPLSRFLKAKYFVKAFLLNLIQHCHQKT